jgi:hypothetical protein
MIESGGDEGFATYRSEDVDGSPLPSWALEPARILEALGLEARFEQVRGRDETSSSRSESLRFGQGPPEALFSVADYSRGVIFRATDQGIEIAPYRAVWPGPAGPPEPVCKPSAEISWSELPADHEAALTQLRPLVDEAARKRRRSFRRCAYCQSSTPPEHLMRTNGQTVCHGCASERLGVVF